MKTQVILENKVYRKIDLAKGAIFEQGELMQLIYYAFDNESLKLKITHAKNMITLNERKGGFCYGS